MFTLDLYAQMLKLKHPNLCEEYQFYNAMTEEELNKLIKDSFNCHVILDKGYFSNKKSPTEYYIDSYISNILIEKYGKIDIDNITYIIDNLRLWINERYYMINIDFEMYKPIDGWCKDLHNKNIYSALVSNNHKCAYYTRLLEICVIFLYNYDKLTYKDLLKSPLYTLIVERPNIYDDKNENIFNESIFD